MSNTEVRVICAILFFVTGFLAYMVETIVFRRSGRIGRYESLWEYFRKIDQKNGNITALIWAAIWIGMMAIGALLLYLLS